MTMLQFFKSSDFLVTRPHNSLIHRAKQGTENPRVGGSIPSLATPPQPQSYNGSWGFLYLECPFCNLPNKVA